MYSKTEGNLHGHAFFSVFVRNVSFLHQLYCFQYTSALRIRSDGKHHTSRTKHIFSLQFILKESLHSPPSISRHNQVLTCLKPVDICLYYTHSAAHNMHS